MPEILTSDTWDEWLPDSVLAESDLERTVDRAEQKVLDRYRESERGAPLDSFEADPVYLKPVQLRGWQVADDGTPDLDAMPEDLVRRLRDSISRIVTHWHEAPGGDIKSKSVGSRSVTYADQADKLPRSVYRPLRPYDDRTPYAPGA
jgi:hypothetical protein